MSKKEIGFDVTFKEKCVKQETLGDTAFKERNERVKVLQTNWVKKKQQPRHVDFLQSLGR